jgi:ABC-2 type transport system permease protein
MTKLLIATSQDPHPSPPTGSGAGSLPEGEGLGVRVPYRSPREWLALWRRLVGARIRGQMQYRVSFGLQVVTQFMLTGLDFVAIAILMTRFGGIQGWTLAEVALLYGIAAMGFGIAELFSGALDNFDTLILRGEFDRYLVRPLPMLFQMFTAEFVLRRVGRIAQGLVLLFVIPQFAENWTAADWTLLGLTIGGGILFWTAILIVGATLCFWTAQTSEVTNIFSYGGIEMLSYPMSIYDEWFRKFFTFVIPMAFINYYPALVLLDRTDGLVPTWAAWLAPLVCLVVLLLAVRFWQWGVRHYQSTGS